MVDPRTLIIHAGGGKAGSSALQSALSRTADDLANVGMNYAEDRTRFSPYEITSGNGFRLFEKAGQPDWVANGRSLIEFFLGEKRIGICSSEFLGSLTAKRWRSIIDTADEIDVRVKVVYFVRSAVGYITSSYHQNVKRSGEHRPIREAAQDLPWQHYDDLKNIHTVLGPEQLRVINYDIASGYIGEAFCDAFPELGPARTTLKGAASVIVNRSLTASELEVMRRVNALFGAQYSQDLSDRLLCEAPELPTGGSLPEEVAQTVRGKFADATKWINDRFFDDPEQALTLEAEPPKEPGESDPLERPLSIALSWALETLSTRSSDTSFVRDRLLAIDWQNANEPAIPLDFDPIAYLLLNPDVLRAELAPYSHYIASGRREERRYRWPLNLDPSVEAPTSEAIAKFRLDDGQQMGDTPVWQRLRHFLQIEALLHGFAEREREYLDVIRKLHESGAYQIEEFKQVVGELLHPLQEDAGKLNTEIAALRKHQSELNFTIERKDALHSQLHAEVDELRSYHLDLNSAIAKSDTRNGELHTELEILRGHQLELSSALAKKDAMIEELGMELAQVRDTRDASLVALSEKDETLAVHARLLERYRQMTFFEFLRCAFRRDDRP